MSKISNITLPVHNGTTYVGTTFDLKDADASHYKGTIGTGGTSSTVPSSPDDYDWYIIIAGGNIPFPSGGSTITPQVGSIVIYDGTDWLCTSYTGGGGSTYTAGTGIVIDANNEISTNNIIWRVW